MLQFLSFLRKNRAFVIGILILIALALIAPAMADQTAWSWKDQSGLLPYRDGVGINLAAQRQGQWLVSDGTRLYQFDGTNLTDLTPELRNRGIFSVAGISATRNQWLIQGKSLDQAGPSVWTITGNQWNDVSRLFNQGVGGIDAVGQDNTWYTRTFTNATAYQPSFWTLSKWNGSGYPTVITLPTDLSNMQAGCFTDSVRVSVCNGVAKPVFVNGNWYMIGGRIEGRDQNGRTNQAAQGMIWRLDGDRFSVVPNLPNFRYVSGVWQGKNQVLVATSDAVTNPFNADQLWVFDGTNLENISQQALSTGLLSLDAREIKAADAGSSWMIVAGKNLIRLDGDRLTSEGKTRDLFQVVSSNGNGMFVLGGLVSDMDKAFATNPLTAKLVVVQENEQATKNPASELISKTRGPRVTVRAIPQDSVIGDGKSLTFRAEAKDNDGVAQISIFVNGARLKTCPGSVCEYTQTYWTNGQDKRVIPFYARATDKLGYASDSKTVNVTIDVKSNASSDNEQLGKQDSTGKTISLPQGTWTKDAKTGTSWIAWNTMSTTTLASNATTTYLVAAQNSRGLGRVDVWVNGEVKRSCDFTSLTDIRVCSVELVGNDYPAASEIFVNANILTNKNTLSEGTWTDGTRVRRSTEANNANSVGAAVAKPVFASTISIENNLSEINRGGTIKVRVQSQSNTFGLKQVDVYNNVTLARSCTYGAVVSPVSCDIEVDTSKYPAGTSLSFSARAIDGDYQVQWSNTKVVFIRDQNTQTNVVPSTLKSMSVWSWLTPASSELWNDQVMTYTAGAWAESGIQKIEIIADGQLKSTCAYGSSTGNKECSYILNQGEYANNHVVIINARVTDNQGNKSWTPVSSVTIKHVWGDGNQVPPYTTITSDHQNGYTNGEYVTLTARGWSPRQAERVQIYVNGQMIKDCPSDVCTWTSRAMTDNQMEYQARSIDRAGDVTWTGVIGINKK